MEQLVAVPARIELKVGESFPVSGLLLQSSAFGVFYYDAALTKKWKYENAVFMFDKTTIALRAVSAGESELPVDSLCKAKRLSSPMPTITIPVVVTL